MEKKSSQTSIRDVVQETNPEIRDQKYNEYVKKVTPTHNKWVNLCLAFVIGGGICTLGEALIQFYSSVGADKDQASALCTLSLVFLSVLFTGLGLYGKLAKHGGAGTVVPITGFANSVAAPAIEFKKEGQVFGIGCKIFNIAGPVILYGIFSSWIFGIIYYIVMKVMSQGAI